VIDWFRNVTSKVLSRYVCEELESVVRDDLEGRKEGKKTIFE
jgi:hypothetical protein